MSEQISESLREALQNAGKTFKATKRSYVIDCPACGKEQICYVLKESGGSICFKCGTKWRLRGILSAILGISFQEVELRLRGYGNDKFEALKAEFNNSDSLDQLSDADFEETEVEYKRFYFDPSFVDVWKSERGMEYLINRGVTNPEVWVRHNLKYQAGMDAIVAPIIMFGTPVGYQARFIAPNNPKFRMKTSDELPRERSLMNFDSASKMESVIVVEGIFDCLKTDLQHHGVGSVATMGKVLSRGQIELLKAMPSKRIYLGLDRDAYDLIQELSNELCGSKEVFRLLPPDDRKDFGECSEEEVMRSVEAAVPCTKSKTARLEVFIKV